ncbi:AbrB/MazE/SpoVT family DNA-binding domain-containing protein [Pseudoduganella sp. FT26W]|uniref:AbrB/MazE/SpoVT family DNA-binding domain-containing protein n=1 Tax=Duganella aquatilis TaxID=2666082 RepID=A0A844CV21_9BURK|nr:AbrB/MazE/SpoVT family DNA-binding domain-containing protein [Duganella aquatilis]MRW83748.1 AbrB/MazE/SpoVT family DNA-binding domain-containing protein [Duganella aquatilis]
MTTIMTVNSRGGITLPKKLRAALGLTAGARVAFSQLSDGTVVMRIKHRKLSSLAGILTREGQPKVSIEEMSR